MRTHKQFRQIVPSLLLAAFGMLACNDAPTEQQTLPGGLKPVFAPGSNAGVNLDQWANGSPAPTGESWQNGNLNGNNSTYAERKAVPFRLAIEGLTAGTHTITINYDFTAGGHKAYDFLASIDATEPNALAKLCSVGGGGRSSLCGTSNLEMPGTVAFEDEPFPGDPFVDPESNKSVNGTIAEEALSRNLRIYNGTITSISEPVLHQGLTSGNSTAQMLVTFVASGPAVQLVWSGHLAYSVYWNGPNTPDGAGEVSGAPWHMRTLNLDNGGAANQDRSIQPSAIVEVIAEANIQISTSGVNELSTWHPMTGHVNVNSGAGFVPAPDGTVITFTIASGPGIIVGSNGSTTALGPPATCTTAGGTGSCTVYLYSTTTGLTTVNASTTVSVSGQTLTPTTNGASPNSGPLTKQWVDAQIDITPLTATNPLADDHVVAATVLQDDGLTANASGGDAVSGFGPAIGVTVTFSLSNNTANATFVAGQGPTCVTDNSGVCSITLHAANTGGVDIHATTTFSINGESVTRATGSGGLNSADAHKDWQSASVTIDKTGDALSKIGDQVTYTFTITNTGSSAVTLVSLSDDKLGDLTDGEAPPACSSLAVGASCTFTVNHTIPAGAADPYVNTVSVSYSSGVGTANASDTHSTELFQPSVLLTKTSTTTKAVVGQTVTYSFTVLNNGSADSPDLTLDTFTDDVMGDLEDDAPATCDQLAVGASCTFTATHTVLVGDADPLVNIASVLYHPVGFPNNITDTDDHSVDIVSPSFTVAKTCLSSQPIPVGTASQWRVTVTNTGDVAIAFNVTDTQIQLNATATIAAGQSQNFDGAGATAQTGGAVLSNTATATGSVAGTDYTNQAQTASATCTYGTTTRGLILPTQTTCTDFATGNPTPYTQIFAGLRQNGTIGNVSPGVVFYYTEVVAPSANFTIGITQTNDEAGWPNLTIKQGQAILYNANCTKNDGANIAINETAGTVSISVTGATVGATYIVGVKYETSSPIGQDGGKLPVVYSFGTTLGGAVQSSNTANLSLVVKP